MRSELEILNKEALRRDDEARTEDRKARQDQLRLIAESEAAAKLELSRWVLRERFSLVTMGMGAAFAILLTFLPAVSGKVVLYGCALVCVLLGARQKDKAGRQIALILPKLSADELAKFRTMNW